MINKLLNELGLQENSSLSSLKITKIDLNKDSNEASFYFESDEPVKSNDIKELILSAKDKKVFGVEHIIVDFKFNKYTGQNLFDYFEMIISMLSKDTPSLLSSIDYKKHYNIDTNTFEVRVPSVDYSFILLKNKLESLMRKYGFKDIKVEFEIEKSISDLENLIKKEKQQFLKDVIKKEKDTGAWEVLEPDKEFYGRELSIKEVPDNQTEYELLKAQESRWIFQFSGTIDFYDKESFEKKSLAKFILNDGESCCYFEKKVQSNNRNHFLYFSNIERGMDCVVQGIPRLMQNGDVVISVINMKHSTSIKPITYREDNANNKRVELHLHTKMSAQDGIPSMEDYCNCATIFGHKALSVTDHGGVQSFHELYDFAKKHPDIKPIYGVELNYVDEDKVLIAHGPKDIRLEDATFVVFDFETTGFSVNYERIIEISAVKMTHGMVTETFSSLVNPEKNIHPSVVQLTGITNKDAETAPNTYETLLKFKEFIDGAILVAHNSPFDMGHLYKNFDNYNIEYSEYPVIDTLILAKALFPNHKKYSLDALCKLLNVSLLKHHRALDDAKATSEIFSHMLRMLMTDKKITLHSEINSILDKDEVFKYPYPKHINLIAQNQTGLVNLYHLVSIASTKYFTDDATITKKEIEKYREGILVGSGCRNSYFFDMALNKSEKDLKDIISFYDYIEVQPLNSFSNYRNHMDEYQYVITDTIKRIITLAKKYNIPVCATGDCHQINEEDTIYRQILVDTKQVGGKRYHYLHGELNMPSEYYMTTEEMLSEFSFLDESLAYEIVVTNTNKVADSIDNVQAFTNTPFPPKDDFLANLGYPSAEQYVVDTVYERTSKMYGELLPGLVLDRVKRELDSITKNKFSTIYLISELLVKKSLDDGYVVGSRGSVGSSFVAFIMNVSEVNSLPPHYLCPKCHFSAFKMTNEEKEKYGVRTIEQDLIKILDNVDSGYDLPDHNCPICNTLLERDGQDIPFETFLGVPENPKTPDIDLNFSGENQGQIHEYIRELFGRDKAFRAGTILTCKSKTAYAIVKDYFDAQNEKLRLNGEDIVVHRKAEIEAMAQRLVESKRTGSQHPGGIVVVPVDKEIYEITPVQYPGDSSDRTWMTTHFDYHQFDKNLFKLDVLGHDDPTVLKYLMGFVKANPSEFPFDDARKIPVNDRELYKFMAGTECIGLREEDILSRVATYGISEFGTDFVRGLLDGARPKTFAELVKVSGLSHGTDVWKGNAEALINRENPKFPKLPFKDIIGCRDDIMLDLIDYGVPPLLAFKVMEFIRKGEAVRNETKWQGFITELLPYKIPEWFIWSCSKIKYMFPKAHATAYIIMALRIAWFKMYRPIYFYSAILSKKMTQYSPEIMCGGVSLIKPELIRLKNISAFEKKAKDSDLQTTLELSLEMCARGFKFYMIDLYKSDATEFVVSDDKKGLYLPFCSIDSLGPAAAISIVEARKQAPFKTKKDFQERTSVNTTTFEKMEALGIFEGMSEDSQLSIFDF